MPTILISAVNKISKISISVHLNWQISFLLTNLSFTPSLIHSLHIIYSLGPITSVSVVHTYILVLTFFSDSKFLIIGQIEKKIVMLFIFLAHVQKPLDQLNNSKLELWNALLQWRRTSKWRGKVGQEEEKRWIYFIHYINFK